DAQRRFVRAEADLPTRVIPVGPVVDDALRIVRVAGGCAAGLRIREAAGERRVLRVLAVDHVEPATARLAAAAGADDVREAGLLVDHDVVRAVDVPVQEVWLEDLRLPEVAQAA